MRIAVVTLLWRNEQYVDRFVRSLADAADHAGIQVELVALRNGPAGTAAASLLAAAVEPLAMIALRRLNLPENIGFAGGMNVGCADATGDVIVAANLDLEFDREFFVALAQRSALVSEPASGAFLAPSVGSPGGGRPAGRTTDEAGALRRDWLHRPSPASRAAGTEKVGTGERITAGNGACIVFGRELLKARTLAVGGLFDEEYHSYFEDVDLFWWAQRRSIPVWFTPAMRVLHHQGGSFDGKFRFADRTPDVQASVMANYRITVWKNAGNVAHLGGWVVGELGYLSRCLRLNRHRGLRTYVLSWQIAARRVAAIRRRRGRLRCSAGP